MFFGDDQVKAQHSLRELVYQLRRSGVAIEGDAHGIGIAADTVSIDWLDAIHSSRIEIETLRAAQRGFLPDYSPSLSEALREWYDGFRATATFELAKAFNCEMNRAKEADDWSRMEHAARACLAVDPLNGHATATLAKVLVISGAGKKAAELLDRYSTELGPDARKVSLPVTGLRRRIAEQALRDEARPSEFPFVGREKEMLLLSRQFEASKHSYSKALLLTGEPGIGKSRVLSEFARRIALDGAAIARLNVHPHDRHQPMGAFISLVPQLLQQPGALGCSPKAMQWLNRLIGVRGSDADSGDETRWVEPSRAIASAVVDLIGAITAEGALVLIVDDVQWIDDVSLELIHEIIVGRQLRGLLLVLASREETRILTVGEWNGTLVTEVVAPLDRTITVEMLRGMLAANDDEDGSLSAWMADIASGNPFYADWLMSHYRETEERYSIPSRLSAIVDQRIAALNADARDVLETIVALGRNATTARLSTILDGIGSSLIRHVRELASARLIVGDTRIEAAHWLIAEAVQRNAAPAAQRLLHRRIALALESEVKGSTTPTEMWECAQAWLAAGDSQRAASMIGACASHALSIGRAREASDLYFQAASLTAGDSSERFAEESIRAAVSGTEPMAILRATPLLHSRHTRQVHDDIELAETRARILSESRSPDRIPLLLGCIEAVDASIVHRLTAARALLGFFDQTGDLNEIASVVPTIEALLADPRSIDHEVEWLCCAALYHTVTDDRAQLASIAQRLAEIAGSQRPDISINLFRSAALALARSGHRPAALVVWRRAHDIAQSAQLHRIARSLRLTLASQHLEEGNIDEARWWFSNIQPPDGSSSDYTIEFGYLVVAADFALHDNDRNTLSGTCAAIAALPRDNVAPRIQRWQRAARRLEEHLQGAPIDESDLVNELTSAQHAGYENGDVGDFEMSVLLTILRERGCDDLARQAFERYATVVRRPEPCLGPTLTRISTGLRQS